MLISVSVSECKHVTCNTSVLILKDVEKGLVVFFFFLSKVLRAIHIAKYGKVEDAEIDQNGEN